MGIKLKHDALSCAARRFEVRDVGMRFPTEMSMAVLFDPRSIIVTGGCGFMGSNFVHYVVREHP